MKKGLGLLMPLFLMACSQQVTISKDTLKDKIAGGWAGKMIGVSYGLPTEFKALGKMYEDSIHWTPVRVKDALWEDDLYVQLTLMDVMDKHGMQARQKKYQDALATAGISDCGTPMYRPAKIISTAYFRPNRDSPNSTSMPMT